MTLKSLPRPVLRGLDPDAADFAPGLLSIQETPPARMPRTVMYILASLFVLLLLWAVFGKLDIIASAEGRLVPRTDLKIVQPADAGIVQEVLVKEGQSVQAGQVLMKMDTHLIDADARTLQNDLELKSLQLRRIDAELSDSRLIPRPGDPSELYSQIESQYRAHRRAFEDAVAEEAATLVRARHDLQAARALLTKLEQTVPTYQKTAAAYEKLAHDGFFSPLASQEKTRDKIEKEQESKAQASTVASLEATITASEKKLSQTTSNYRSQLENERVETLAQYKKAQDEWAKIKHKAELLELRAPHAGIVKDMAVHTLGTVVSPGSVLLTLVPQDEPLEAEVMVKNEDVGFVYPDQKARIKLATYPFQKYGMVEGKVVHVSADATEESGRKDGKTNPSQLVYKVVIRPGTPYLELDGERLKLAAGMQVIAEIHQGRRTVLEYLLSPVRKAFMEAGRER